jgi:hypothetical protein
LLGLFIGPENGGNMFLHDNGLVSPDYTAIYPRFTFLNENPLLGMLMSGIRGLGPFWQNSYVEYGAFLNKNFIQSKVLTIYVVLSKSSRNINFAHEWL